VSEPVDGRLEFSGRLADVSAAVLTLEEMPEARREIPRRLVTKAKLELTAFGRTKR
jgi:ribosome maturation factor RimP